MKTFIFGILVLSAGPAFGQEASPAPDASVSSRASAPLVLPANTKAPASALVQNGAVVESKAQQPVVSSTVVRSNEVVNSRRAGEGADRQTPAAGNRVKLPANSPSPVSGQHLAQPIKESEQQR